METKQESEKGKQDGEKEGKQVYTDGRKYVGGMKENKFHGYGEFTWPVKI